MAAAIDRGEHRTVGGGSAGQFGVFLSQFRGKHAVASIGWDKEGKGARHS